jgi:hypothetical protein
MALGLVVLGAILSIFVNQSQTNAAQQEVAYAQQNVRAAMDLMLREIRNAGYNPDGISNFSGIVAAHETYIRIQSDLNGDGDTDDAPPPAPAPTPPDLLDPYEDVTYKFDSANRMLRRGVRISPTGVSEPTMIVENVTGLQFAYVLRNGAWLDPPVAPLTLAQRNAVRAVIIRLSVRTENRAPDTREFRVRGLESGARIRNLGFQDVP